MSLTITVPNGIKRGTAFSIELTSSQPEDEVEIRLEDDRGPLSFTVNGESVRVHTMTLFRTGSVTVEAWQDRGRAQLTIQARAVVWTNRTVPVLP